MNGTMRRIGCVLLILVGAPLSMGSANTDATVSLRTPIQRGSIKRLRQLDEHIDACLS